jgi:hypothetical protein
MSRFAAVTTWALAALFGLSALPIRAEDQAGKPPSKFEQATVGAKKADGFSQEKMWNVYYKDQQILVDLKNNQLNKDFIVLTSIARGVSSGMVIGGMTWGDDVLWQFRKVGDKMHVVRRNVRFKAKPGTPEASAVKIAYGDSILYSLPIVADTPQGNLVDMTRVFFSDDEMVGRMLNAHFVMDRSTVAKIKSLPNNCEIQIAAVYAGNNPNSGPETVVDPRGMQVVVHYSISELPDTHYKPRLADDRVGYFLTATKDFSDQNDDEHFVRYITRWDLQKADPSAKLSPPKQPIRFYLEKTVPIKLRPIIRAGILEWNKAFEKLGYDNAIEVLQQTDDAEWDPEDVNYNTFRWITAEAGFAMGPSRVNPLTGQILDADIIFDASFLRYWKQEYENLTPTAIAALAGEDVHSQPEPPFFGDRGDRAACRLSKGMQRQMGFAAAAFAARGELDKRGELPDEFLMQALKEVVMHETGHTLGLRHNFKASAWKTMSEIEDPAKSEEPIVASVMDYSPVNVVAAGAKQTAYYTTTIGPYDYWAIEYGYKPVSGDESAELAKIASRSGEAGLDDATDEDTRGTLDPDPLANRFDLGKDPMTYSHRQMAMAANLIPKILDRAVDNGDGYQRARQAFGLLFGEYWRTAFFTARIPGGVYVHRDHKGDNQARMPLKPVEVEQQRGAMKLLADTALSPMVFDSQLLNSLAATRWSHWGMQDTDRVDYPIHDNVANMQSRLVGILLSSTKLNRLLDGEVKTPANEDAYTLAEHLRLITNAVFKEVNEPAAGEFTNRTPYLNGYRRSLQRITLKSLTDIVTAGANYPNDARVLTRMLLTELDGKIKTTLEKGDLKLDDYSKSHLLDSQNRVRQALNAELSITIPAGVN